MSLVESNPNQTMFFNVDCINDPYSFELYRLINDVVDKVDVGEVNSRYDSVYGRKAYDRSILLKCVLKAYCSKAYSSREIERHINNDMTCYLLAEGNSPNHVTIANFLNEGSELIRKAFETLNEMAIEEEFATVDLIAIDGTKIKADASMSNVITMDGLDLIDELEEYFEYFSDIHDKEERHDVIKDMVKSRIPVESRNKRIVHIITRCIESLINPYSSERTEKQLSKCREELERQPQSSCSMTDPESKWMVNKKGQTELDYNIQVASNSEGYALSIRASQNPTDIYELIPMIEELERTIGKLTPDIPITADNGYYSDENLEYLEKRNLDGYIATRTPSNENQ